MNATLSTSGRTAVAASASRGQPRRSSALRVVANAAGASSSGRDEALRQMRQFRSSLSTQLTHHEAELKKGNVSASSAGAEVAVSTSAEADLLEELHAANYHSKIEDSDGLVVVKWTGKTCGPCKMILPKVEDMAREFAAVSFYKIFVNAANKDVGTSAGVRVAPTFLLFKGGEKVAEVVGAKEADLRAAIEEHA